MKLPHWLHHLFTPHCPECEFKEAQSKVCLSCEILKTQLEFSNIEKMKLLEAILHKNDPLIVAQPAELPQPIRPRHIPWSAQRQMLEENDRQAAQVAEQKRREINATKPKEVDAVAPVGQMSVEDIEKELMDADTVPTAKAG